MTARRADLLAVVGLSALWLTYLPVIGLEGEFPLNDDWAYARATQTYLETGRFERLRWTWTPIVTHVAIGSTAARVFGFSFETLRATSYVFGLLGVLGAYALGRSFGVGPAKTAIVAGLIAVCPVYVNLAFTFMTDVPFTALVFFSLACLVVGLKHRGYKAWFALGTGVFLAAAATLSRQPGIAIVVALVVAVVTARIPSRRWLAVIGVAVTALASIGLFAARMLLEPSEGGATSSNPNLVDLVTEARFLLQSLVTRRGLLHMLLCNSLVALSYIGFFAVPVLPWLRRPRGRAVELSCLVVGVLTLIALIFLIRRMPPGLNLIYDLGLGARTLDGRGHLPHAPVLIWWVIVAAGAAAGFYLVLSIFSALVDVAAEQLRRPEMWLLVFMNVFYLGVLACRFPFFDRYLSASLAPIAILASGLAPSPAATISRRAWSIAAFIFLGLFSVLGTRDYMEHHRARARLVSLLERQEVSPTRVDGGFEYAGWHNYSRDTDQFMPDNKRIWVHDDEYLITHAPSRAGYELVESVEFRRFIPPVVERLYLLHRLEQSNENQRSSPEDLQR